MRSDGRSVGLVLALVACGAVLLALWRPTAAPRPTAARPESAPASTAAPQAPGPARSPGVERAALSTSSGSAPALERPTRLTARGRVRDPLGAPVADVGIGTADDRAAGVASARSGADGWFELMLDETPQTLVAVDPRWVSVRSGTAFGSGTGPDAVIVVAPSIELAGRVVDPAGSGLIGAELRVDAPLQTLTDAAELRATTQRELWTSESADEGRFLFSAVPSLDGARLVALQRDHEPRAVELPESSTSELVIELVPSVPDRRVVAGQVVHADGTPAAGSRVQLGNAQVRADGQGAFRLTFGSVAEQTPLVAVQPGHQPAVLPGFGATALAGPYPLEPVRLELGGEALSIRGRVLDARGEPLARWTVELMDATPVDPLAPAALALEELAGGQARSTRTDKEGRFVLEGLVARSYVLRAHGARPRAQILSDPIEAGSRDVELRLPAADSPSAVRGQVLSLAGEPVPGVRVDVATIGSRRPGEPASIGPGGVTTDLDGGFLLEGVPAGWIELVAGDGDVLPAGRLLAPGDSRDDVRIRVERRRRLRFASALDRDPPDELRAIDAQGAAVPLWTFDAGAPHQAGLARLRDGASGELSVGEAARELVIYRRGEELDRLELTPPPGELGLLVWP